MAQDKWTIHNDPNSPQIGNELNGLHIEKTGARYEITEHNVHNPLVSTNATAPPFQFPSFLYEGLNWIISVSSLPVNGNGSGSWQIPTGGTDPGGDPTDGDFTAQAGSGTEEDENDADSASSAYA